MCPMSLRTEVHHLKSSPEKCLEMKQVLVSFNIRRHKLNKSVFMRFS